MPEQSNKRAESEPWWSEFVEEYKKTPLRELARRFSTNPRRLRRAAQRSGLDDEPDAIRENAKRLGTVPDASLADALGVTPELIKGARARRDIPAFDPATPQPAPKRGGKRPGGARAVGALRSAGPRPRPERYKPDPSQVEVVVRRAPVVERARPLPRGASLDRVLPKAAPPPAETEPEAPRRARRVPREDFEDFARKRIQDSGRRLAETLRETEGPPAQAEPAPAEPKRPAARTRRRRIVPSERLEDHQKAKSEPEPAPSPARPRAPRAAPVRTLFDASVDDALPPDIKLPEIVEPASAAPEPPAPVLAPDPAPAALAPRLWQARVDLTAGGTRELVIAAPSLQAAARLAEAQGTVRSLHPAEQL